MNIAQGASNAGKVLGIGSDGNVTPVAVSSGGENWEEVNLHNLPTDFTSDERIRIQFYETGCSFGISTGSTWEDNYLFVPSNFAIAPDSGWCSEVVEINIPSSGGSNGVLRVKAVTEGYSIMYLIIYGYVIGDYTAWNRSNPIAVNASAFTGISALFQQRGVSRAQLPNFVKKMWRLKK